MSAENVKRFFDGIDRSRVHVTTALHSDIQELHDRVTCAPGSHGRSIRGLLNVMQAGIPVTVKQVISRWNVDRLPDFVDFSFRTFGPAVSMTLCGMYYCGMKPEQIEEVAVGYREIGPKLEQALDLARDLRLQFGAFPHFSVADLPLCCTDPMQMTPPEPEVDGVSAVL